MRELGPVDTLIFPAAYPRKDGDVSNGVLVARHEFVCGQLFIHDAIETPGFVGVPVDGVFNFLGRVLPEMVGLPQHRPHTAHLKHQPLQHLVFGPVGPGQELAGLGGEVQQNGA